MSPGNYGLAYIVESQYNCPSDTALFTITVTQKVTLKLETVDCVAGGKWELKLTTNAPNVSATLGTVQKLTLDTVRIYNIPQGQGTVITASSSNGVCMATLNLDAPNCACPLVPEPTGNPTYSACEASGLDIQMTVSVPAGMQAVWYSQPSGGTPLATNTLTYAHTNGLPGIYKYYVETLNPADGCFSLTRFEIVVEIFANPTVQNYVYVQCDALNDGVESFALATTHGNITSLANSISFHTTQADALAGINILPDPYSNTSAPQVIYALVTNQPGCKSIAEVTLNLNPVPAPVLTVTNESCLGSGNGSVSMLNPNPAETYQYTLDNQNWTTNTVFSGLAVSNYVLTTENQFLCRSQTPFTIGDGLLIQIQNFTAVCDNKGTLSDPTDDVYKITLLVGNNLNVSGSFRLDGSNGYTANYTYNVAHTFDLPANGVTITFTLTDLAFNCTATRVIGPLNSCSTDCVADLNIVSYTCNGYGTPSDPGDDFYELVFNATALNGAANNMYVLFVDNVPQGSFTYGTTYTRNIPATNQLSTVRIQDAQDTQCNDSQDIGPLNSCSDQCILSAVIESIECINPGSSPSPLDDYYEVTIKANIVNGGGSQNYKLTLENGTSFTGTYNVSLKLTIPADGLAHILNIVDDANASCSTNLNLSPLEPCSGPCEVSVSISQVSCSNNGTTNDSSDDTYQITILAELINGGSSSAYTLTVDGKDYSGTYGQPLVITLPADGKAHQINVVDAVSIECKGSVQTDLLLPCSLPCSINATVISYDCNNGGTTSDNSDDTYTVTILANITNGAGSLTYTATADGKDYVGTYGQPLVIPFMADNSIHTINILDKVNSVCLVSISTPLLAPCSGPCVIDAVISNIQCNNAGTNDTDADDVFTFDLLVTGNNTKWKIDLLGVEGFVGNVIKLGPFPIAGASNSFLVYYENSPNCKKQVNFTVPATCSECTQTVDAGTGGELSCTQNSVLLSGTGTPGGIFSWILNGQTVTSAPTLNAGEPGKYFFKGTYPDGCEAIDSVIVSIDADLPVVSVTRGLDLTCEINEVTLTATASGTNLKYEWTTEEGIVISEELSIKVTEEGKYFFRAYNPATGCSSAKVLVEVLKDVEEPSSVIYAKPTAVFDCVIKTITLYNDSEPDVSYTWQANGSLLSTNQTVEISTTGDYTLIAVDTITGCFSKSSLVISSLIEYPIINLTVEDTLDCLTSDVYVSANGSQVGPEISYEWRDKNNKVISNSTEGIQVTQPGNYYLILKDASNGCINEDTASVEVFENEIDIDLPLSIFVKQGDTVRLNTILNIPASEIGKITWSPTDNLSCTDCLNPVVVVAEDATYTIEVEDIYGCKGIAQVRLIITRQEEVNIPNIISVDSGPNGGFTLYGNNEVTIINYLKVYDRWGNLVYINTSFEPNKPELGWDGTYNGKAVVPGVFVYVFEVQINGIGVKVYAGDVTVVK
ncbi:MAG: gliding motility-associated C-terminal domain-containing protein [Saprospiraceae bacterium]|nr:gliding motility-associated C-terminal domain-containing protein [Saprospiraceae bacterium]